MARKMAKIDNIKNVNYRWTTAYKCNTHNVSQSSLAVTPRASIKVSGESNVSAVDAAFCNIAEYAIFEEK